MIGPIVIGGFSGSGTRMVAKIVKNSGVYMEPDSGGKMDSQWVCNNIDSSCDGIINSNSFDQSNRIEKYKKYKTIILGKIKKEGLSHLAYGWKAPRDIYHIKALYETFKNLLFIHLIRDGRDMALSKNTGFLRVYGKCFFNDSLANDIPIKKAFLWNHSNVFVRDYIDSCKIDMSKKYLIVRYEDVCQNPESEIARIQNFIGLYQKVDPSIVEPSEGIGRWSRLDDTKKELKMAIQNEVKEGLEVYNYETNL